MCVWSAYAGKKNAAPVVFDALRKIEGFWAGHYTGIATCCDGKIHFSKCAGSTDFFATQFSLDDLPGNMALAHSRTASGGFDNRAHPFVGTEGIVALVSQGSAGVYADTRHLYTEVLNELYNEGRRPRSGGPATHNMRTIPGLTTPDGNQVSAADVETNEIERRYMIHGDITKALREAALRLPGEHCSICLFADRPGVIGFINMNQRVCYAFEEDGVYLATAMPGLPRGNGMEIPGNSVGYVTADGVFHREVLNKDLPLKTAIPAGLEKAALEYLKANPGSPIAHICDKALRPLFAPGELDYHAIAVYRTIENLLKAGLINYEVAGRINGSTNRPARPFLWSVTETSALS